LQDTATYLKPRRPTYSIQKFTFSPTRCCFCRWAIKHDCALVNMSKIPAGFFSPKLMLGPWSLLMFTVLYVLWPQWRQYCLQLSR